MTSVLKKPRRTKLKNVDIALRKELNDIADEIKDELKQIVTPFESNVNVITINRRDSGDYIVEVLGNPNDTATINAAGASVSSHDLIKFLDGGTSIQYVGMPSNFVNETTPNSKDTRQADYDRDEIYFLPNPVSPGIEARNWFKILLEETKPEIKDRFDRAIRGYLR